MTQYEKHPQHYYTENSWCAELLADHERFHGLIYDPACGSGNIPKCFAARGHPVMATDIAEDRPYGTGGIDFLADAWRPQVDNIITNPPYDGAVLAQAFIEKALTLATKKVAAFVPLQFLASSGRHSFYTEPATRPSRVYVMSSRPSCPPGDKLERGEVIQKGGMRDYMWLVWHLNARQFNPTTIDWLVIE